MEDIGGVIFYIIAAVFGILTMVKKKKGVPKGQPTYTETIDKEVFGEGFDYMVDDEADIETDTLTPDGDPWSDGRMKETASEEVIAELKISSLNAKTDFQSSEPVLEEFVHKGITSIEDSIGDINEDNEQGEEVDRENELSDALSDFDLRNAIIYSEVLNRKDY